MEQSDLSENQAETIKQLQKKIHTHEESIKAYITMNSNQMTIIKLLQKEAIVENLSDFLKSHNYPGA